MKKNITDAVETYKKLQEELLKDREETPDTKLQIEPVKFKENKRKKFRKVFTDERK